MVLKLIDSGMTQTEIVKRIAVEYKVVIPQSTISKIVSRDADPGYRKGRAIERLYADLLAGA